MSILRECEGTKEQIHCLILPIEQQCCGNSTARTAVVVGDTQSIKDVQGTARRTVTDFMTEAGDFAG